MDEFNLALVYEIHATPALGYKEPFLLDLTLEELLATLWEEITERDRYLARGE